MITADLLRVVDTVVAPALISEGWHCERPGDYTREEGDGQSRLSLDVRNSGDRFSVLIGYNPSDVLAVYSRIGVAPGFICGPFLNQTCVTRNPRYWASQSRKQLLISLDQVLVAIRTVGYPWLLSLKDPRTFAENADPNAPLLAGFAWERIGKTERANEFYIKMKRRFVGGQKLQIYAKWPKEARMMLAFVNEKLGLPDNADG